MTDPTKQHDFLCDGKSWSVSRQTTTPSMHTGLCFRQEHTTRFLVFTRGALPSDAELRSMSAEVLCVLLRRAVAGGEVRDPRG